MSLLQGGVASSEADTDQMQLYKYIICTYVTTL